MRDDAGCDCSSMGPHIDYSGHYRSEAAEACRAPAGVAVRTLRYREGGPSRKDGTGMSRPGCADRSSRVIRLGKSECRYME